MSSIRTLMLMAVALGVQGCGDTAPKAGVYTGYIEANYVYIGAPQAGWLTDVRIREGQQVQAGQPLFDLDTQQQQQLMEQRQAQLQQAQAQQQDMQTGARTPELQALQHQLQEAQANLDYARQEQQRMASLVKQGLVATDQGDKANSNYKAAQARVRNAKSAIQVAEQAARPYQRQEAEAGVEAASAALAQAQYQLQQRHISSQVSGQVSELLHRKGEFVTAGAPVLSVLTKTGLKVRFFVHQAELPRFHLGMPVTLHVDGDSQPIQARLSYIAEQAEFTPPVIYTAKTRSKLVFMLEAIPAQTDKLHPGQPVEVSLP